eukprot:CAMPEP_0115514494 /NCGR_PEP_ID=MMETSP0271-20121206/75682_1 /TAXON_ID=71861 /ORGANISM="Scrippsiella trochoidea, Strain CCMP3099" /LENGTH=112 /DNA_ID=CAMNT_0002944941 /DNA_START=183 /DNA_END=521 /DNA_ORIENTATION=+
MAVVVIGAGQRRIVDDIRLHDDGLLGHEKYVVPENAKVLVLLRLLCSFVLLHVDFQRVGANPASKDELSLFIFAHLPVGVVASRAEPQGRLIRCHGARDRPVPGVKLQSSND